MSLITYLAHGAISSFTHPHQTSKDVFFGDYMVCASFLYEMGAILGYTFRDRLTSLVKLWCEPGREVELAALIGDLATSHLASMKEEPRNLVELYTIPEGERMMRIMRGAGLISSADWLDFPKAAGQKLRLLDVFRSLETAIVTGAGLGGRHPELTVKLWCHQPDVAMWNEIPKSDPMKKEWQGYVAKLELDMQARGNTVSPEYSPFSASSKSIVERQAEVVSMVRPYVAEARPDLLSELGL